MIITKWVEMGINKDKTHSIKCSICGEGRKVRGHAASYYNFQKNKYCGCCGTYMWYGSTWEGSNKKNLTS